MDMFYAPDFNLDALGKTVVDFFAGLFRKGSLPIFLVGKTELKARLYGFTQQLCIARKMSSGFRQLLRNRTAGIPGGFFLIQLLAAND